MASKVIIEKSRGEVSLMGQDTIENFFLAYKKWPNQTLHIIMLNSSLLLIRGYLT
jgi:hypothetical protein